MVAVTSSFFVHFTTFSITIGKQMKSIDFELKLLPLSVLRTRMFCSLAVVNIDTMPDISREHLFVGLLRPAYSLRQGRYCLCITAILLLSEFCVSASLSLCVDLTFASNFQRYFRCFVWCDFLFSPSRFYFSSTFFRYFYLFVTRQMYSHKNTHQSRTLRYRKEEWKSSRQNRILFQQ